MMQREFPSNLIQKVNLRMAQFFNQATLSYNAGSTTSNVTVGELLETLSASKTALPSTYSAGDTVTYAISIVNAGAAPFTGLAVTDDLGEFTDGTLTLVPMDYLSGSVRLYVNGTLSAPPAATTDPLTFSGINIPAGGNALLLYQAAINEFAPLTEGSSITNTAVVSGGGLTAPITVTADITAESALALSISKAICPSTVTENEPITYTFVIQNSGSVPAVATDNITVTDTFTPALSDLTAALDGTPLALTTDYTYDPTTGQFATVPGRITVPAATYTRDPVTGAVTVEPGVAVLTVTGTI